MTKKDEEGKTWVALVGKIAVAVLGAMAAGGAGSVALAPAGSAEQEERIAALEESCQRYDVRLSTQEAETSNLKASYVDIKKDLAEIRGTSTQILFELQKDRRK